ncbi:FAD-dependent monooxygenase [Streptomyces aidingensis]|uniref:2,4-dichlorophenol 6-monooxygenase n=1 Tax=Streptomyces aidingensis TaxID=910347 RepID=A0A1I1H6F4_9ACTN|nr:FAD-dependent monooxygenase [Streptomyces aidingensis]SFC19534.1 2,4-dichlorophenol 6-monooxygenase [Streptomyces aidingensis]
MMTKTEPLVSTDVPVVGTGPAGAAAAALLSAHGVRSMAVSALGRSARTPRAHLTGRRTTRRCDRPRNPPQPAGAAAGEAA